MTLTELALRRAGAENIVDFQKQRGLYPSGNEDVLTMQQLTPYLLGYLSYMIRPGDTYWAIAGRYGTTVSALRIANPELEPENLPTGLYMVVPLGFPVVPTDIPVSSQLVQIILRGLVARYPFLRRENLGYTWGGRPITAVFLGQGPKTVLYNASHHANEWITTPVLLRFLEDYARACALGEGLLGREAGALAREVRLCMVPLVNPDGVDLVTGAIAPGSLPYEEARALAASYPAIPFPEGWKANLRGTDLNLNYPAGWEEARRIKFSQGYRTPAPRDYVGDAPLDQPETATMAELTRKLRPRLTLSYHSQGRVIYWKYLDLEPPGAKALGRELAQLSGYRLEDVPRASGYAGYKDWFILNFNRPGFTVEVGLGNNPLPLSQFEEIYRNNLPVLVRGLEPDAPSA